MANEKPRAGSPENKGEAPGSEVAAKPVLLAGGNPQIPKGYGDAPVQAYIAAMPGWKSDVGRRIDQIITSVVPEVSKAVKWNSPFMVSRGRDGLPPFIASRNTSR